MAEATKTKSQQFLAAQKQAQAELGVQGPPLSMKARPAPPKAPIEDTAKMVSPPTLRQKTYEDAIRRRNDRLAKPKAYDFDEKAEYFSNDKPIIRRPEDKYYNEYAQNEQTGQINREKQFSRQQKSNRLLAAQQQAQAGIGVQAPAMTGRQLIDNRRVSSGWASDVSGVSPRQSLIDQAVADDKMKRGRGDMTSSQRQMVDNPVDQNRPNVNYQPLSPGPSRGRQAWSGARLNERMGDTTPAERREAFDANNPNAAFYKEIGLENAKQAKARKDDDIALFRLQRRGLENSSQGSTIQQRIKTRKEEFSAKGVEDAAERVGLLAEAESLRKNPTQLDQAKLVKRFAKQQEIDKNAWKIDNLTGAQPFERYDNTTGQRSPDIPLSAQRSPFSMDTERIRAALDAQNLSTRNYDYQDTMKKLGPLPPGQSRGADAFAVQQKFEEMYKPRRDLQQQMDNQYRNEFPPIGFTGDIKTYDPTNAQPTDFWNVGKSPSTGVGNIRMLPNRLIPVDPNSKSPAERKAWLRRQAKMDVWNRYKPTVNPPSKRSLLKQATSGWFG